MFIKKSILALLFCSLFLFIGCQHNADLKNTVGQQQQQINEMQAKLDTLGKKFNQMQDDMKKMKKKFKKMQKDVKKVQPNYIEGAMQEG